MFVVCQNLFSNKKETVVNNCKAFNMAYQIYLTEPFYFNLLI